MKLNRPKTINCSASNFNEALNNSFSNVIIETEPDEKIVISDVAFDSCIFNNINFSNIKLDNVDLIDVIFKDCDLSYMDFTGSYGAVVNPQVIYEKSLKSTNLTDALLVRNPSFDDCYVTKTTFSGQDVSLNPQTLRNKTINHCHFNGVEFIGNDEMFKNINLKKMTIFHLRC